MLARRLLALPAFVIVSIYAIFWFVPSLTRHVLADPLQAVLASVTLTAFWLCALIWALAVFLTAQKVLGNEAWIGRTIFSVALVLVVSMMPMSHQLTAAETDDPLQLLLTASIVFAFVSIGLAASALLSTEGKSGFLTSFSFMVVLFAMFFLPVGIWFLKPGIGRLLEREAMVQA